MQITVIILQPCTVVEHSLCQTHTHKHVCLTEYVWNYLQLNRKITIISVAVSPYFKLGVFHHYYFLSSRIIKNVTLIFFFSEKRLFWRCCTKINTYYCFCKCICRNRNWDTRTRTHTLQGGNTRPAAQLRSPPPPTKHPLYSTSRMFISSFASVVNRV